MTITVREKGKTLEQGGGMVLKSDMWLAPTIAAMKEVADFDLKYAQKKGADGKASTAFLTTTTEVLKVTTDVAAADVAIPAGYQQK